MVSTWRLFIATELPESVIDTLAQVQHDLKANIPSNIVRWVKPENTHLTLKFLGDVPVEQRSALEFALADSVEGIGQFELSTDQLGCFPNLKQPRVIWIGIIGEIDALNALQQTVEATTEPLGFAAEKRPFRPHLTLGRIRRGVPSHVLQRISAAVRNQPQVAATRWTVQDISLYRSELHPAGAVYTTLKRASLRSKS